MQEGAEAECIVRALIAEVAAMRAENRETQARLEAQNAELAARVRAQAETIAQQQQRLEELAQARTLVVRDGTEVITRDQFQDYGVERVVLPASIREIGDGVFAGWRDLKVVEFLGIPNAIAPDAFSDCPDLRTVVLQSGELQIRYEEGNRVVRLHVPRRVREITYHPAYKSFGLNEVIIEKDSVLERIGDRAFLDCERLSKITVDGVAESDISSLAFLRDVGAMAFFGCTSLGEVKFPESITVGNLCVWGTKIENWNVPPGVPQTPEQLGINYRAIKKIQLPEGIEVIEKQWFQGSAIEQLEVPASVREIEDGALRDLGTLKVVSFTESSMLEKIGNSAFANTGLESFVSPVSLRILGNSVFQNCKNLCNVKLQSCLERIGDSCFCGAGLQEIEIYQSVKFIGNDAFSGCTGVTPLVFKAPTNKTMQTLRIPENMAIVKEYQFQGERITELYIPACVKEIGNGAFRNWVTLEKVTFAEGSELEQIGSGAFAGTGLVEFVAPERLKCIGAQTFTGCDRLKYVSLNDALMQMDFGICKNLKEVHLSTGVFSVAYNTNKYLFSGVLTISKDTKIIEQHPAYKYFCVSKVVFEQPCQLEQIGQMAFCGTKLQSFCAPTSLRKIAELAFGNCTELQNIELNNNLQELGDFCFLGTKVKKIRRLNNTITSQK